MINKLRKKIFWIIQISLSIIILGVIVIITGVSYRNTIKSSSVFIERLEGGKFIRESISQDPVELPFFNTSVNLEGVYRIEIDNNKVVKESDGVTDEIRNYAIKISNKNAEEGCIGKYVYRIRRFGDGGQEITLMENEDAIRHLKNTIMSATAIGLLGIFATYIIAKKISKTIVEPVADTFEKQKQFISDASHELKTPLAVIEANADVLQGEVGKNKWITYIQNEVQSMNKLVNELLILAKMENNNSVKSQKFNLSKEAQMSVAVFESMTYEKKIKLKTNIDDNIEFKGEKEDIKHIVSIILDNAIKHTEEGKQINVNVCKEKGDVKIEIANEGDPIPEGEQEKIFERFYRVDKARNRNEKRYGLGLSIAKKIVDKYHGTIHANSKDGFTTFTVKLINK